MLERYIRPMWAFVFRDWHLTRRYVSWVVVFVFYAIVNSATIALIGKAQDDFRLTLTLLLGVLLWSFLSAMYNEIANSISYERWEGTLEYTFMAPVSRLVHLSGVSLFAIIFSVLRTIVILVGLVLFVQVSVNGANLLGVLVVLLVASLAFMGLGLMAAVLPVMSPENGAQATNIFQGIFAPGFGHLLSCECAAKLGAALGLPKPGHLCPRSLPQVDGHQPPRLHPRQTGGCTALVGAARTRHSAADGGGFDSAGPFGFPHC
jgi:ABC-type transport system involved in cytochrome c biogenesis permease component